VAFGTDEKAAALAFERIGRDLRNAGIDPAGVVATHVYPVSVRAGELALKVRPSGGSVTAVPVEGIASVNGSFAIDVVSK
jgi:hypothetical protein